MWTTDGRARAHVVVALVTAFLLLVPLPAAQAADGLQPFYSSVGNLTLSLDGIGTVAATGTVQAEKPSGGTVQKAFLFSASTGFSNYIPTDTDVTLDGHAIVWNNSWRRTSLIGSYNVAADVTAIVSEKLNAAPAGTIDFTVGETKSSLLDGEILAVVWQSASARARTISLLYGALAPGGDHFNFSLAEPLKPSSSATMSLGISFGCQVLGPCGGHQYSQIKVNGSLLTSSAGGEDDGTSDNGALMTVGGIGDSTANPSDPTARDDCGSAPRCDDELYGLKSLVSANATAFSIDTNNPSNDDNVMLAAFDIGGEASVGSGVLLTPGSIAHDTSSPHTVSARVQRADGSTVRDGTVTAKIISGPNAGASITGLRVPDGRVVFTYSSSKTGTDAIQATYRAPNGDEQVSNVVDQRWFAPVKGTSGWAWAAPTKDVTIKWSYGGEHRYLGNAYQGGVNWNNAGTNVKFVQWKGGEDAIQVQIVDAASDPRLPGWKAWLTGSDTLGTTVTSADPDAPFAQATMWLWQRGMDTLSDASRTSVVTHELGHAIGLDHTQDIGGVPASTPSVMWAHVNDKGTTAAPQTIDIDRVNGLYSR